MEAECGKHSSFLEGKFLLQKEMQWQMQNADIPIEL